MTDSSDLISLGLTPQDIVAFRALLAAWPQYFTPAVRKRHFGITVNNRAPASPIPFTPGRIASIFIPSVAVWMGGDTTVTSAAGNNAGLPIVANAQVIFGPEEGDSQTYLIAAVPSVDVRCLELLPAPPQQ